MASETPAWRLWVGRLLRVGIVSGFIGLIVVAVAVGVAYSSLPSYSELKSVAKRADDPCPRRRRHGYRFDGPKFW